MNEIFENLYDMTAFSNIIAEPQFLIMYAIAFVLLYLGIKKQYEPLLLVPIAFGVLLANFPGGDMGVIQADENGMVMVNGVLKNIWEMPLHDIAHELGIMNFIYYMLIKTGFLPPIIFMGVGALTDFGPMLRNLSFYIRCSCTVGYLYRVAGSHPDGIHSTGSRFSGHYRWRGWSDSHLYHHQTGAAFAGPDCHCRLFVYGARSGDYSAGSETVLYEERVEHQHERTGKEVPFED